jgi:hypothetical protein
MTEAEWLKCSELGPLLGFLHGKVSDRKIRLFAVGCCRQIWRWIKDRDCQQAALLSEQYADGGVDQKQLRKAERRASDAVSLLMDEAQIGMRLAKYAQRDAACAALEAKRQTLTASCVAHLARRRSGLPRNDPRIIVLCSANALVWRCFIQYLCCFHGLLGTRAPLASWLRPSTTTAVSPTSPSSPTPSKTPAARTAASSTIAAPAASTSAAAGSSICCWAKGEYSAAAPFTGLSRAAGVGPPLTAGFRGEILPSSPVHGASCGSASAACPERPMARNYYSEINLHLVWHTKSSRPLLTPQVEPFVHRYLRGRLINSDGVLDRKSVV